jgi:hypothetical protein
VAGAYISGEIQVSGSRSRSSLESFIEYAKKDVESVSDEGDAFLDGGPFFFCLATPEYLAERVSDSSWIINPSR